MYLQHRQAWTKNEKKNERRRKNRIRKYEETRKMKYGNNSLSWKTTTRIKLDKWIFIQIVRQHMLSLIILLSQFARLSFSNHNEMRLPSATIQMENNRNDDTTTEKRADMLHSLSMKFLKNTFDCECFTSTANSSTVANILGGEMFRMAFRLLIVIVIVSNWLKLCLYYFPHWDCSFDGAHKYY